MAPYANVGGKSKGFCIQGYEVKLPSKISKDFNEIHCDVDKEAIPYQEGDCHFIHQHQSRKPFDGNF
eukprot:5545582-Ditylum_brightwellii.AAC.1